MKIDRHSRIATATIVKLAARRERKRLPVGQRHTARWLFSWTVVTVFCVSLATPALVVAAGPDQPSVESAGARVESAAAKGSASDPRAETLLKRALWEFAAGPAFLAKLRQTVWATNREVVGVGTYEQSGGGSGRFHLQLTMHDGDGKHSFQQISDGRLAWTRTEVSDQVVLRRVDVGRFEEWIGEDVADVVPPRLRIGGFTEMLDTIERDFTVRIDRATLQQQPVWVITGSMRQAVRERILVESGRDEWPKLCPTKVRIAIRATPDPSTNFGMLLPARIEYWSDPVATPATKKTPSTPQGRLITLIELYGVQPIQTPPPQRFRFDNQDAEVNFINDTERYIERFRSRLARATGDTAKKL